MKKYFLNSWDFIMDNRYNPLRIMDMASQHYFMQVLAWMWSMVFSMSFLSIFHFQIVWLAHVLFVSGLFVTVTVFRHAESRRPRKLATLELSKGSKCVWQLDREA